MSERDIELCKSFEQKLRARGQTNSDPHKAGARA
jgi:hypothetical protein